MNEEIKRHIDARVKCLKDAQAIATLVETEKRAMTNEEKTKFEKLYADAEMHKATADALQKGVEIKAILSESAGRMTDPENPGVMAPKAQRDMLRKVCAKLINRAPDEAKRLIENMPDNMTEKYADALKNCILKGWDGASTLELRKYDELARKDYQIDIATQGGYILPVEVSAQILLKLLNLVYVRKYATVLPLNSYAAEIPSLDEEPTQPSPSGEVSEMSSDTDGTLGRRLLRPHLLPIVVKIARDLLHFAPSFEGLLIDRVGKGFERKEEQLFMTGTGNGQPLGLFTSAIGTYAGIPSTRNKVCGSATAPTYAGILDVFTNQKKQYRDNSEWLVSRAFIQKAMGLVDNINRPLWVPSLAADKPDMLLGRPVLESEYVPNTFSASQPVGIFGDLSYYWIAQFMGFEVQPLLEKYATTNQLGFACRQWVDGMPMLSEAFTRMVLAA